MTATNAEPAAPATLGRVASDKRLFECLRDERMSRSPWNFAAAILMSELSQAGEAATSGVAVATVV